MLANKVMIGTANTMSKVVIPEGYVMAQDSDFSGTVNSMFKYIGTDTNIYIPHIIKQVAITSYNSMFIGTSVTKVFSNNPKVTNMYSMFNAGQSSILDLSDLSTKNVTNMALMFYGNHATSLDLSTFDTNKVTTMYFMFRDSGATTLDLSSFDTSNVVDMEGMFYNSKVNILDLSSFDTSKVTDTTNMFWNAKATTGYARTQADADKFNTSSNKPSGLTFIVKP